MTALATLALLYAPGDRPDLVVKALSSPLADGVIIDLEDAVAPTAKTAARAALRDLPLREAEASGMRVQVRINPAGTPWHADDLAAIARLAPSVAVRVPKVDTPDELRAVSAAAGRREVHALLETALGVERAFEIASAGVASIGLGEADLRSELGVPAEDLDAGMAWARSRIVNASAAAGIAQPLMSAFTNVSDLDGLERSCRRGRALGLAGRAAIHPRQLPVIRSVFAPTEDEIDGARAVLDRVKAAQMMGAGTVVLEDGTFLDAAMIRAAQRVVALGERLR
ncbi:CoA ester lyase [Microbacterium invictum]|uniref:CoA ester lyase n=1 Tax=Microbacterium invictum TaxID=515415 RepID=A0ABZ0VAL1_9MICO|nr:CoA ester lyase [Microbacterium invictum]WQB69842.1 CoA ester lyase [Microbacterium invictum]